ncbi:SDR family oxidoreductase [Pedosphaera parvula]|uniref:dTDP-4-dehydrorhamnose reductase n=1 Tax=Pedosphaera parvula (strain Ellin514) TaxID=320771 RepID=B9XHJ8_PEDPL|nr:sugar nucleotide-binding protein [Pedosphaera parvula]EEF60576.1 dTDP-4-dehydrorhamnose reductase [Pedosphaera parvula Ellin514]
MILLLGATGYIGQAFATELQRRHQPFTALSRKELDYTKFELFLKHLQRTKPEFVVNAAGYTGKPNVDACENAKADTLQGNTLLPQTIAQACAAAQVPWGHVSSGCIYSGAKIRVGTELRVERDLTRPDLKTLVASNPQAILGFTENDEPNFSFRQPPCSFYSGTKALAEEAIQDLGQSYIWRLRIPFDECDNARNYLTKVQRYPKVYDNVNSISQRADFVSACLDLWQLRAPFGIYNVTNPGFFTTRQVVSAIERILKPSRRFEFWESDEEFYQVAAKTPRSNCVMDTSKLLATGVKIRSAQEALEYSLRHWKPE